MRIRIFHNNARDEQGRHPAWERGFLAGDTVTEVFGYDVPVDELEPFAVEGVYDLFNIGHDPNYGKPDIRALDYHAAGNRCFSMGDVVAVEDTGQPTMWFACASSGWDQIDPPTIENVADHGTNPIKPSKNPQPVTPEGSR
jgi:hypothetical protein